jgi:phenylalanine-4-hydroxylase
MRAQQSWIAHFYPDEAFDLQQDPWFYLQKFMVPLIQQSASSYHLQGMAYLELNNAKKPDFNHFQTLFYKVSNGFKIQPVKGEIAPRAYFELIRQKKFPCIEALRPLNAVFCANEPDFWHEAIGHIAPLCFPEVQDFYLRIAGHLLSARTEAAFQRSLAIAWTLSEYGFLREQGQNKLFGAALVGSHLAHMRYQNGLIAVEPATSEAILQSQFYSEIAPMPRDEQGRFRFFCLSDLNIDALFQ